eukprot:1285958-Amphidinium_carterae.3
MAADTIHPPPWRNVGTMGQQLHKARWHSSQSCVAKVCDDVIGDMPLLAVLLVHPFLILLNPPRLALIEMRRFWTFAKGTTSVSHDRGVRCSEDMFAMQMGMASMAQ